MLEGGCFCRNVRYETRGAPMHLTHCHCSICRKTSGAPFVSWFSVAKAEFRVVHGSPTRYRSSSKATRSFCPQCGTQLTFEHDDSPGEIDITTCSLDDPERLPPLDHTRTSSQLGWIKLCDGLPRFPESRSDAGAKQ